MGESNGDWGREENTARADAWDRMIPILSYGENLALDRLLESKGLTRDDLARIGTKVAAIGGKPALTWLFPDGFKYRVIEDGQRLSDTGGIEWTVGKLVRQPAGRATKVVVAEGETDAAMLMAFGTHDVYMLPNGARGSYKDSVYAPLRAYEEVLIGTDNDDAGDEAAEAFLTALGSIARRVRPPGGKNDWCEALADRLGNGLDRGNLDDYTEAPRKVVYSVRELIHADLGSYEENHWFESPIAPMQGQVAIHGPQKSLKSFILMEYMRAICTADSFAGYVPFVAEGPGRVLLVQFEVPPLDFFYRVESIRLGMSEERRELFDERFLMYGIADRRLPRLKATDKNLLSQIRYAVGEADAQVVAFDPVQRMTGAVNVNQMHELDALLTVFDDLKNDGLTVVFTAHDKKERGRGVPDGESMVGSQRFGADPDVIGHVWHPPHAVPDDNTLKVKQRQVNWTLRSGVAEGRLVTVKPYAANEHLVTVDFGPQAFGVDDEDDGGAPPIA